MCSAYKQNRGKLDPRCDKGIFVGYDKNSPSYLAYYPDTGRVCNNRLVKFLIKTVKEWQTQTDPEMFDDEMNSKRTVPVELESATECQVLREAQGTLTEPTVNEENTSVRQEEEEYYLRHSKRERKAPAHLKNYECKTESDDFVTANVDYCYHLMSNTPQSYKEAINSPEAENWVEVIKEEIESLKEKKNKRFTLTRLAEYKNTVGG